MHLNLDYYIHIKDIPVVKLSSTRKSNGTG